LRNFGFHLASTADLVHDRSGSSTEVIAARKSSWQHLGKRTYFCTATKVDGLGPKISRRTRPSRPNLVAGFIARTAGSARLNIGRSPGVGMKRREFITLLSGAAAAWPLAARAQQRAMPIIGFLGSTTPSVGSQWVAAFVRRLRELGWIEGRTVAIEVRWAEGRSERFAEIAAEFVRLKVDVIVTHNTPTVLAAKQATSVIPIVFATAGDPVGSGLVASLTRPGGNVTGLSSQTSDVAGKRLEFLREAVPALRRLAILANVGNPGTVAEIGEVQAAARTLGLEVAMDRTGRTNSGAPPTSSTRFCAGRSRPTSRSSSRPSSTSSSTCSPPRRSASPYPRGCSHAPTR
jgi:hypothetical protein